jgi:hypothetical protein
MAQEDGQLHTLGLLEQLRDQCKDLWGTSSELYFRVDKLLSRLANPNLHDIPSNLQIMSSFGTLQQPRPLGRRGHVEHRNWKCGLRRCGVGAPARACAAAAGHSRDPGAHP